MKIQLACLAFFLSFLSFSQSENNFQEPYERYFELPRETLFIHLNKTSFIAGEDIWFKTYAYDRHQNLPSKATTNINVGIYDDQGKLIKNNLWLAINGSAKGNFTVDSTYTSGEYYIKASTNWMKNFEESDAFTQKIRIIGSDYQKEQESITNQYDFQFLPEGGHLVSDVNNALGFKIINSNGKGVRITGTILDGNDQEVTSFKSNKFGIGKCLFRPKNGESYTANIVLPNGKTITKDINGIKSTGIAIQVNNSRPNDIVVNLTTNSGTLPMIKNQDFTLAIHKDGKLKSIDFKFEDSQLKTFIIPKTDLFNGVTILTLFNEKDQPILERLIFKYPDTEGNSSLVLNKLKTERDSISVSLYSLKTEQSEDYFQNLSFSVLPASNTCYDPDHNIISATLLEPYLKGTIEDPKYYFTEVDNKKKYELDLLLITQGWSRYSWNSIFNNTPKPIFEFENGVTLVGKVNGSKSIGTLRLQDPKLKGYQWTNVKVNSDNTFEVKKYFPLQDEIIRMSYFDKNGKLLKPNLYVRCVLNNYQEEYLPKSLLQNEKRLEEVDLPEEIFTSYFFYQNTVELDEVVVEVKNEKKKVKSAGMDISGVAFRNNYTEVTQDVATSFPTVIDLITSQGGYTIARNSQFGGLQIVSNRVSTINGSQSPAIFLDDIPLSDFDFLITLPTSDIEGIVIDKYGIGSGLVGPNGVIRIYTRRTPLAGFDKKDKAFAHSSRANVGFSAPKQFYMPKYINFTNKIFENYGTVAWFPNIELKPNKSQILKIPDTYTDLNIYIEGFDSNGELISEVKTLRR